MIDIGNGIAEILKSKKRTFPQSVNRISAMDDPCLRRLFYRRAAWDKATPTPDSLQGVFETGNILEPVIERIVSEVGHASTPAWRIVGSQTPTNDALLRKYQISGSIDGFLQIEDAQFWQTIGVVDVKTMSGNVYPSINSYADLGKFFWTRGYRGQLQLYALAHNLEQCFILAVNKNNLFDMKLIQFPIDMDYIEGLLQKAETVNKAVAENVAPVGINSPDICTRCQWYSFCSPPITTGGNMQIIDNAELEAVLIRMEELTPAADEYADLEKTRDHMLIKGQDMVCGPFIISWKETANHQWRKKIVRMKT